VQERGWGPGRTNAGVYVDEDLALRYAAVWRCVDVISKAIAILPWCVYQKTSKGRKEVENDIYWLLHNQPNPEMQPYAFKHLLSSHVLLWGNAYAEIERDLGGRPKWLWPITPDRVTPSRRENGAIVYLVSQTGAQPAEIEPENILHIRGLGFDGLMGYSPIRMAAQSIGAGIAMDKFGAKFFANGANMGGTITHPQKLNDQARKNLRESIEQATSGDNANRWLVLEEGLKAERMSIPPDEAQFLESRKFSVLEICRWYGVPPHKVMALDRATWANVEQLGLEFVTDTIQPWVTQFEQEADLKLFGRVNRGVFYTKFNLAALLRGDMKSRYEAYEIAHRNGWMNANEIRALEELNPIPNGGMYVMQAQMTTREQIKKGPQAKQGVPGDPNATDPSADPANDPTNDPVTNALRAGRVLNTARRTR
jgi:HK97 family phage portal protein